MVEDSIDKMYEALDELSVIPSEEASKHLSKICEEIKKLKKKWENLPKVVSEPDLTELVEVCNEYIDSIKETGRHNKDGEHWIFEESLKAIYGDNIFDWVNENDQGY